MSEPTPLRPALPRDAAELANLHATAFDPHWSDADIAALLRGAGVVGLVASEAGFILVQVAGGEAEVLTIAVRPERRGAGVGRRLLEGGAEMAAAAGAAQLHLEVAVDNAAALRLYAAAGFARAGLRRGYYARADGRVDALVLTRTLPPPEA